MSDSRIDIPTLHSMTMDELAHHLPYFITEIRTKSGDFYKCTTLYSIWCGINRVLTDTNPSCNLFTADCFADVRKTFDGYLKERKSKEQSQTKNAFYTIGKNIEIKYYRNIWNIRKIDFQYRLLKFRWIFSSSSYHKNSFSIQAFKIQMDVCLYTCPARSS